MCQLENYSNVPVWLDEFRQYEVGDEKLAILAERAQRFYAKYQINREIGSEVSQSLEEQRSVPELSPSKEVERFQEQAVGTGVLGPAQALDGPGPQCQVRLAPGQIEQGPGDREIFNIMLRKDLLQCLQQV